MTPEEIKERHSRQRDIVPSDRIAECKATVVGVGAIGRQVVLQLTAMGVPWLQLIDFDEVESSNLASQGYLQNDLSRPKVQATGQVPYPSVILLEKEIKLNCSCYLRFILN